MEEKISKNMQDAWDDDEDEQVDESKLWQEANEADFSSVLRPTHVAPPDVYSTLEEAEALQEQFMNELSGPHIGSYRFFNSIQAQVEANLDLAQSDREELSHLERSIIELDANRYQFELVTLHRLRLQKITAHVTQISSDDKFAQRLSLPEQEFATKYSHLRDGYMMDTVLGKLPNEEFHHLNVQDERSIFPKVDDLHHWVVFRAKRDLGEIFPNQFVAKDQTFACPYSLIQNSLEQGDVVLL